MRGEEEERWKGGENRRRGGKECEEEGRRAEKSRGVKEMGEAHIHILSRPGRYLGGNLARTRKFLASERKFFGQQLTVAASKSSSTTLGIWYRE